MITYTAAAPSRGSCGRQRRFGDEVDGVLRRTDRVQALLGVPGGARGVCDAHDDPRDVEAPLGDLGDDQVRVVAAGGGDEDVRLLDAGLQQRVDLQRGADG